MKIAADKLKQLTTSIFAAAGCTADEAQRIAHYLVEANLAGHDSHGVIRVMTYVKWLREGMVLPGKSLKVVFENDVIAVVDGEFGFGKSLGEQAMKLGIDKSAKYGVAVVALRNSGHLGQIGAWAKLAAKANRLSLHWVNTSGLGILMAPFGGINRRISANPIAAGVPARDGTPIVLDISSTTVAEGKIRVALNKGVPLPDGCLIDPQGQPTNDPKTFYGPPPGAILPFGGHKGYGLGIIAEVLAGALTGGHCSTPGVTRLVNNMLSIFIAPSFFQSENDFHEEVEKFITYVKSSERVDQDKDILMPGEPEEQTRTRRLREGIEIDETTWRQLAETAESVGIALSPGAL